MVTGKQKQEASQVVPTECFLRHEKRCLADISSREVFKKRKVWTFCVCILKNICHTTWAITLFFYLLQISAKSCFEVLHFLQGGVYFSLIDTCSTLLRAGINRCITASHMKFVANKPLLNYLLDKGYISSTFLFSISDGNLA